MGHQSNKISYPRTSHQLNDFMHHVTRSKITESLISLSFSWFFLYSWFLFFFLKKKKPCFCFIFSQISFVVIYESNNCDRSHLPQYGKCREHWRTSQNLWTFVNISNLLLAVNYCTYQKFNNALQVVQFDDQMSLA